MAPPTKEKDVLELQLGVDVSKATDDIKKFRLQGQQAFKALSKVSEFFGKGVRKFVLDPMNQVNKGFKNATKTYKEYGNTVNKYNAIIASSQKKMLAANEDDKKSLQDKIARYKELKKQATKEFKAKGGSGLHQGVKDLKGLGGIGKDAGKGFWQTGVRLFRKDMEGAFETGAQTVGKIFSSGKITGKWAERAGKGFWDKAKGRWSKAKDAGSIGGKVGHGVMAAGHAAVGGMSKGLEGILKMLGSLGPILAIAGASFAAIVKLMIDAEASAKELNKKILETAGSSQMFYKNSQKSENALEDMGDMLKQIRDSATSLDNIKWGINKEDHMAVLNALSAEGVSLDQLRQQYKATGDEAKDAAGEAKMFGDAVHVAVAYSREFGVSLQEISSFQGEMMTELGSSLDDTKKTFHMMTKGAAESGIATNKFFAIIRGVSADLNLYNTRIEDAVHMLGTLGKVMSPRNAAKFLGASMQAVKNMGRVERIKLNLLAGGSGGKLVDRDIKRSTGNLASKMASASGGKGDADKYQEAIEKGGEPFMEALKDMPENMRGELREAQLEISMKKNERKGGGLVGTSIATGDTGPAAQLQLVTDALKRFNGKSSLAEGLNSTSEQFLSESMGISSEQLKEYAKVEIAMKDQKNILKKTFRNDQVAAKLDKAGIKLTGDDAKDQKAIDEAGYDQIMDTMDEGDKAALQGADKEIDYAKQTSQYTSTVADKLETIIQWLMNKLWDIMNDIYDAVSGIASSRIFGGDGGAHAELVKLQLKASRTGNKEIRDLADKSTTADQFRNGLFKLGQTQEKAIYNGTDAQREGFAKTLSANMNKNELSDAFEKAMGSTGLDEKKGQSVLRNMQHGNGFVDSMKKANLSSDEQAKILDKIRMFLTTPDLMRVVAAGVTEGSSNAIADTTPPAPDPPSTTPTVSSPTAPTSPGMSAAHAAVAAQATASAPVSGDQGEDIIGGLDGLQHVMETKGIKMNKSFLRNQFWKDGHDAVLDANRESLFEFFLYSKMDPGSVAQGLKDGNFDAGTFGKGVAANALANGTIGMPIKGMATGGVVPEPKSPDQVFVAARPGESIVPKGAGAGASITIPIHVDGPGGQELGQMMKSAAMTVVAEWQRRHRFT